MLNSQLQFHRTAVSEENSVQRKKGGSSCVFLDLLSKFPRSIKRLQDRILKKGEGAKEARASWQTEQKTWLKDLIGEGADPNGYPFDTVTRASNSIASFADFSL